MRKFTPTRKRKSSIARLLLPLIISLSVVLTTLFVIYGNTEIRSRAANGSAYQDVCAGLTGYRRVMCEETDGAFTQPKVKEGTPCKKGDPPKPCGNNGEIFCSRDIYGRYFYDRCFDDKDIGYPKCTIGSVRNNKTETFRYEYVSSNDTFHTWTEKCTKQRCKLNENGFQTYYEPINCTKSNHEYISHEKGRNFGLLAPGDGEAPKVNCNQLDPDPCTPGTQLCSRSDQEPGVTWLKTCETWTIAECPGRTFTQYDSIKCLPGRTCVELGNNSAECR